MYLKESEVRKIANILSIGHFTIIRVDSNYYPHIFTVTDKSIQTYLHERLGGYKRRFYGQHVWELRPIDKVHALLQSIHPYTLGHYRLRVETLARYIQNRDKFIARGFGHAQYAILLDSMNRGDYSKYSPSIEVDPLTMGTLRVETDNPIYAEPIEYSRYNLPCPLCCGEYNCEEL